MKNQLITFTWHIDLVRSMVNHYATIDSFGRWYSYIDIFPTFVISSRKSQKKN